MQKKCHVKGPSLAMANCLAVKDPFVSGSPFAGL